MKLNAERMMIYTRIRCKMLYRLPVFVGFSFHEYAHAITARAMGDMQQNSGRLTLDPMAHVVNGIINTYYLNLKPVPINPNNFRKRKGLLWFL